MNYMYTFVISKTKLIVEVNKREDFCTLEYFCTKWQYCSSEPNMAYPTETSMTEDCFKQWFISATEAVNYNNFFSKGECTWKLILEEYKKGPGEILRY